jgi:hypothetical protein
MAYKSGLGYYTASSALVYANGDVDCFTITGLISVNLIYSIVTVAAGAANLAGWGANPTTGTTNLFCVVADIDTALVGDTLSINSVAGTLTTVLTGVSAPYHFIVPAGTIFIRGSAVQGTATTHMFWTPITTGSTVVGI